MKPRFLLPIVLGVAACQTSTDPADGGFFNGVSALSSGTYDDRIAEREASVEEAQARNAALTAEQQALARQINASKSELSGLKLTILQQRDALGSTDPATAARIDRVLNAQAQGSTPESQLASLQRTIAEAKALSADLSRLAG